MNVVIEMKLYISFIQTITVHCPFQLVVLDGGIANCHYTAEIITKDSKFCTIVNIIIDIANSFI